MSESGPSGSNPECVHGAVDQEEEARRQYEPYIAILQAMLQFRLDTGILPESNSTDFHRLFTGAGYFKYSRETLAEMIEFIKKAFHETVDEMDQLESFVFPDRFQEQIFELCKMIWSEDEKFNRDSIQDSFLIDPISRKPVVKTGEIKGGYNFHPDTDNENGVAGYLHQDNLDDIALLKAVLCFYHNTGVLPPAHSRELYNFVSQSVFKHRETDFTRPIMVANILRCENNFMYMRHMAGFFIPFKCPLEQEIYDLARQIWGDQSQNDPHGAQNEQDFDARMQKAIEANVFRMSLLLIYHNY